MPKMELNLMSRKQAFQRWLYYLLLNIFQLDFHQELSLQFRKKCFLLAMPHNTSRIQPHNCKMESIYVLDVLWGVVPPSNKHVSQNKKRKIFTIEQYIGCCSWVLFCSLSYSPTGDFYNLPYATAWRAHKVI
jgi:hypothetical protein